MDEVLAIDIGGTKTNVSFVKTEDLDIKVLNSEIFPTQKNPEIQIQKISSIYDLNSGSVDCLSLSLPGLWDANGVLQESFFLHEWLNYPFIAQLKDELRIKKCIWETDVICAALGEYHALDEYDSMLYINLGTGIGAALIVDGKPYKMNSKLTLRMQKLVLPFQDELFSGVDLISGGLSTQLSGYPSIEALFNDYKLASVEALDFILKAQYQLAGWLINLFYLFSPDVIVLGGGLTNDWEVLAQGAIDIAYEELEGQVQILPSKLRENAPIFGAYINYKEQVEAKVT